MAKVQNPWVGYLDRSYIQIKNSLLQRLGNTVPEVTDHSESNILVIIISMFAGIAEQLNYYIDNMAREAFITTARRYSSAVRHARLVDYRIKAAIPASADITINLNPDIDPTTGPGLAAASTLLVPEFTIPRGTEFRTLNGISFLTIKDIKFSTTQIIGVVPVEQKIPQNNINLGITTGNPEQVYPLGNNYVHNSLELTVGGEIWERVDTLGRSKPQDKHYIVDISVDKVAYIVFGDGINGKVPPGNSELVGNYYTTSGKGGNVGANTIVETDFDFSPYVSKPDIIEITNPTPAVAGIDYEDLRRIQRAVPLSIRTLDRAVTRQDYIDIARLAPGVDKATLHYDCGKTIKLYISPNGGGVATQALRDNTKAFVDSRKMVTTFIEVLPTGESYLQLDIKVYLRPRRDPIQARKQIVKALVDKYNYEASDVNRKIRTSDIIALVDNLPPVDYLELQQMYVQPYMRPLGHYTTLLNTVKIQDGSTGVNSFEIRYYMGVMKLFKNGLFTTDIPIGIEFTEPDNVFTIFITPNNYENGDAWEFKTYPKNSNLEIDDYTVPVLREGDINVEIEEQLTL